MVAKSRPERARPARGLSPHHERQVRLLIRLLEAPRPLSATEIYTSVDEYRQRYDPDGDNSSLEKMFERDRAALTRTGIEIGTVPDPTAPGDRARWHYRIVPDEAGGASLDLTAEEALVVDEVSAAWLDPALRTDARRTFVKLLGQADSGGTAPRSAPRTVVSTDMRFGSLRDAVAHRRRIRFDYLKAGATAPHTRDVDAVTLFSYRGRWLLHGFDHGRAAPRNFLLARIRSDITEVGIHERDFVHPSALTASLDAVAEQHPVTVRVRARSEAEARLSSRALPHSIDPANAVTAGWHELVIHDADLGFLADELAGLGSSVEVLAPTEIVSGVRTRLERMIAAHRDEGQGAHV